MKTREELEDQHLDEYLKIVFGFDKRPVLKEFVENVRQTMGFKRYHLDKYTQVLKDREDGKTG